MTTTPLLQIRDLVMRYRTARGVLTAVDRVDLDVHAGETVALIGESGCGKTSLGKAVVRLATPQSGSVVFEGTDLTRLDARHLQPLRAGIQMVFQDPLSALDPRHRAAKALALPLALHGPRDRGARERAMRELLARVELSEDLLDRLPHQLSGGQRQRLNIARALATQPKLVVCDEPVSALDMTLQAQILTLLADLQRRLGVAYLFISHDLSVVEQIADRIAVMYLGRIIEVLPKRRLWTHAAHPYTRLLLDSVPGRSPGERRLDRIPLSDTDLPSPYALPGGCRFQGRCPLATAQCRASEPPLREIAPGQTVACHLAVPGTQARSTVDRTVPSPLPLLAATP